MDYRDTDIYKTLRVRTHKLTEQIFREKHDGSKEVCPVTAEELAALEDAVPVIYRFADANGDFTLDPVWGWRFRVMDVPESLR